MLEKIKDFTVKKAYTFAFKKGVDCPSCTGRLKLPEKIPEGGLDAPFYCHKCGWYGVLTDIFGNYARDYGSYLVKEKPESSEIIKTISAEGQTWSLPSKKRFNGSIKTLLFVLFVLYFAVDFLISHEILELIHIDSTWLFPLIGSLLLVLILMFYFVIRPGLTKYTIIKNSRELILRRSLFGRIFDKKVSSQNVTNVKMNRHGSYEGGFHYSIEICSAAGKSITFGGDLTKQEKSWMLHEIRTVCGIENDENVDEVTKNKLIDCSELKELDTKYLKMENMLGRGFRMIVRPSNLKFAFIAGALSLFVGSILMVSGVSNYNLPDQDKVIWVILDSFFAFAPFVFGGISLLMSAGCLSFCFLFMKRDTIFEFGENELHILKRKKGEVFKTIRVSKSSVKGVRVSESGSVNEEPRYKALLLADKPHGVVRFREEEVVNQIEARVKHWLEPVKDR